jgi:hypothetical protein
MATGCARRTDQFCDFSDFLAGARGALDHFTPEQIWVVEMHDYQTRIGPVSPEQTHSLRDHYVEPGELLTVDPARLEGATMYSRHLVLPRDVPPVAGEGVKSATAGCGHRCFSWRNG